LFLPTVPAHHEPSSRPLRPRADHTHTARVRECFCFLQPASNRPEFLQGGRGTDPLLHGASGDKEQRQSPGGQQLLSHPGSGCMSLSVLLWALLLMSGDGASGFLPVSSFAVSSFAAQPTASAPTNPARPTQSTLSPSPVLGLRGGMQDVDDWGPADEHHKYDLSRLVADPAERVLLTSRALCLSCIDPTTDGCTRVGKVYSQLALRDSWLVDT
jgi:hypothetical protein